MAKKKKSKQPKPITVKLPQPMEFDEIVKRIVRVKPPKDEPRDTQPPEIC
jgi:hypothetical protein